MLCASNLGANPNGADCSPDQSGQYNFQLVGGTSASSPAFAGVLALVSQQLGGVRLGQADYTIYPLSQNATGKAAFHDITTGNNAVYCDYTNSDALDCESNSFLSDFDAGTGYDEATGLGSLDVAKLVQNWSSVASTFKPTTTTLNVNGGTGAVNITHGAAVNVSVTVTGSGGTPTGDVALVAGSGSASAVSAVAGATGSPSILTLSGGSASNTSYTYLPGGSYNLTANYGGDGTFASSTSTPVKVTVSPEPSTLGLFIQQFSTSDNSGSSVTSVPYGTYISVAAQPVSTAQAGQKNVSYYNQATGTVTFTSTPAQQLLDQTTPVNSNGIAEIPNQLSS